MRAVGLDPSASVVTTAAVPGGAIVAVAVRNGRSYRAKEDSSGARGVAGAPKSVALPCSIWVHEMTARALQGETDATDAAEKAEQVAADESYARPIGSYGSPGNSWV